MPGMAQGHRECARRGEVGCLSSPAVVLLWDEVEERGSVVSRHGSPMQWIRPAMAICRHLSGCCVYHESTRHRVKTECYSMAEPLTCMSTSASDKPK